VYAACCKNFSAVSNPSPVSGFQADCAAESHKDFSMAGDRYRISPATIALFREGGREMAHMIPADSVVTVDSKVIDDGNEWVEVLWAEKKVMMFNRDIRIRGEKLQADKPS